jgi:glucosamine--fructose-6-phosphate aminotransferase (isomerizing)
MLADIWETPTVMRSFLEKTLKANSSVPEISSLSQPFPATHKFPGKSALEVMAACLSTDGVFSNKITIIGCGTSYHVALLAEYLIEGIARVPVEVAYASEYRYKNLLHRKGDVVIAISSSGETLDTLESLRSLKRSSVGANVLTVGVVNEADSSVARESDVVMATSAGSEVGIASTKVFSATSLAFVLLALALGNKCGTLPEAERDKLLSSLRELPELIQMVLDKEAKSLKSSGDEESSSSKRGLSIGECKLWDIGCQNVLANNFIFLGRGFNFPIALEGAMKCKELAYIHAEGYPAAEMKHGPIALIDQFMPVVVIAPRSDPTYEKIKANIEETKARNGSVIAITEDHNTELTELCEHVIMVPPTHEFLIPLIVVIPLQLLAYMMGILRGNEVDHPRGLSKTIDS